LIVDVTVIGLGHAGAEAACIAAKFGVFVIGITVSMERIGHMPCNPAVGGPGKSHLVREIDALSGIIGECADKSAIQLRVLNKRKGRAVQALRIQVDREKYWENIYKKLKDNNIQILQDIVNKIEPLNRYFKLYLNSGEIIKTKKVIITSGTFLNGLIHIGRVNFSQGRQGEIASTELSKSLLNLGIKLRRFKTGTPPRIDKRTIDFSRLIEQKGENLFEGFSFFYPPLNLDRQLSCYITYTNRKTHQVILENLNGSPLFTGIIEGIGPRYCPSIEDKVVNHKDIERFKIFLEPEGFYSNEIYLQGFSSSLPEHVQLKMTRTLIGLENCEMIRPAYGIEYDCIDSRILDHTLQHKSIPGLYFAGQVNGTSGYEEAAAQGIVAGINAALNLKEKPPVYFLRENSYIGVLIDDLVTKGHDEPYRMFTTRVERKIALRDSTALYRLGEFALKMGLFDSYKKEIYFKRKKLYEKYLNFLENKDTATFSHVKHISGSNTWFARPVFCEAQTTLKYKGYEKRELERLTAVDRILNLKIPAFINYYELSGLKKEIRERLRKASPSTLKEALKVQGISFSDVLYLRNIIKKYGITG